ncbi:hypothetical protein BH20ACI4_BH20ACI4_04300 [soil metagenome]
MMKVLRQFLLLTAITVGFSFTAMAQQQDDKKTPKKEDPPKIKIKEKENDKPKDDKKDNDRRDDKRKPELAFINDSGEVEII